MVNKNKHEEEWAEAIRRCRLSTDEVRMARELGMTPRALLRNIPSPSQAWKAPVKQWIRELHAKRFGRKSVRPDGRGATARIAADAIQSHSGTEVSSQERCGGKQDSDQEDQP